MQQEGTNSARAELELLRRHLLSGRSRTAPLSLLPADLVPLASHEAIVGVGDDPFSLWTLAANLQAPCLVAVTARRAVYFDHLLVLGLFSITAGPQDFYARLTSRDGPGDPSIALLRDTTHHVCRAVTEQLGHRLYEAQRATIFERAWRHAFSPPAEPGFLRDPRTFAALERLCRSGKVEVLWGDARTYTLGDQVSTALRERQSALGALAIFDVQGEISRHLARGPWERLPWSDTARVFVTDAKTQREMDRDTLLNALSAAAPPDGPIEYDPRLVENVLSGALRDEGLFIELLDEALASPYPPLLSTLFRRLSEQRYGSPPLDPTAHPFGPILDLCDSSALHDDDPTWRQLCDRLVEAPAELRGKAVNALAQRLGLFE